MSNHDDVRSEDRFAFVLGTRPEIIKLAPLIRECQARNQPFILIHTGQHYSDSLDSVFFEQLELPTPDYHLGVGSASHGEQTGEMLIEIEEVLLEEQPDVVFVQGDTNSVLAGAIATSKLDCELAHVEAGLRSFDRDMPEETNRVVADHVADYLFAPTEQSREYLHDEGIEDRIFVTGNTIVDAVQQHREFAATKSSVLEDFGLAGKSFGLLTAHRAENVDDADRFASLLEGVGRVGAEWGMEIIYPIHPRAQDRLDEFDLSIPEAVTLVEPQDYLDFLKLEVNATLVLTDSGGVQEEACILGIPCVTLRDNTERPETLRVGANRLAGVDSGKIMASADRMLSTDPNWENPFGAGDVAEQILGIVSDTS
jgi:UDP-N-acetylglucosamine 2-epimerase (non-hydrolysing)